MDSNPSDSTKPPPSLTDPNLVNTLVEELKSKGIFDQIRSDALAEVDTKPAYQNLRQRVETSVSRYLNRTSADWKPTSNKAQLRNMLRKHIQDSGFLETGVHNIVDQVVGPKIQQINPEVENILYTMFGMEKPDSNDEEEEMMEDNTAKSEEKLSNISSDIDVEMKSDTDEQPLQQVESIVVKEHEGENMTDASSPGGPGLRGDISPLTPEKATSPEAPRGDVSPLTPPPPPNMDIPEQPPPPGTERTPSPRTPPGPPPRPQSHTFFEQEVVEEEIITREENVSPVSEGEFGDISPPKGSPDTPDDSGMPSPPQQPPLPPLPPSESGPLTPPLPPPPVPPPPPSIPPLVRRPPSPITSPMGSSSDERLSQDDELMPAVVGTPIKSVVSASDISDAELPLSQSEKESSDDLEDMEKARAELLAKLASAGISDEASEETSEGEITSDNNKSQKSEAEESDNNKSQKSEADEEEKAEKTEEEKEDQKEDQIEDDHEQAKREMDKDNSQSPKDPDDSNGAPGVGGNPSSSASSTQVNPSSTDSKEKDSKAKETSSSSNSGERRSSKDSKDRSHHHHRDHKDPKDRRDSKDHKDHQRPRDHKDHNRHRDHKDRDYKRSSSSSSDHHHSSGSSSSHKKSHKGDRSDRDHHKDHRRSGSDHKSSDSNKHDKSEKNKQRIAEAEAKVKENDRKSIKTSSGGLFGFDMFAEKVAKIPKPPPGRSSSSQQLPQAALFTPPSPVIRASPAKPLSSPKPVFPDKKAANNTSTPSTSQISNSAKKGIQKGKEIKTERRSSQNSAFIVHEPRVSKKSYPELQALQKNADKSHEEIIAETKRLLEKSRLKKEAEIKKEKELKRQRKKSASHSGSSPNKSGFGGKTAVEKISDSNSADSADDIKRYDNDRPDSPKLSHQKTPKNATPPTVKSPFVRRKSAKESNLDSDSDSDVEWKSNSAKKSPRKNKTKRQAGSSSEDEELGIVEVSGEAPIISTRKTLKKNESEALLNDKDDDIEPNHGFIPDQKDSMCKVQDQDLHLYEKLLANEGALIKADQVTSTDLDASTEPVYIENANLFDGGAPKLATFLKKHGGGQPKAVSGIPEWLAKKLQSWKLKRNEVEIITEPSKIRKRRIYTEEEYDLKSGVQTKKAKVVMMDDIGAQLAQLESQDSSDDMETQPLSKTLKPKQTPVKSNKTPVKNNKKKLKTLQASSSEPKQTPVKNNKTPIKNSKKKLKTLPASSSEITPPNEEKMELDLSDDENGFTGFVMDDSKQRPKTPIVSGNCFGIEGLECYDFLEKPENLAKGSAKQKKKNKDTATEYNDSKIVVIISPGYMTHMRKVLGKDKEAMTVLNKIKKDQAQTRKSNVIMPEPEAKTTAMPITQIEKTCPTDYPLPPSPESNSPSDTSDKGSTSPQEDSLVKSGITELPGSRPSRRSAGRRKAC